MTLDPNTRHLLIDQVARTLSVNLQPMLADIVAVATRPSVVMRPNLIQVETAWIVAYGDCTGCGATPEEAMADFDKKWSAK